jgi:hypothetical protein
MFERGEANKLGMTTTISQLIHPNKHLSPQKTISQNFFNDPTIMSQLHPHRVAASVAPDLLHDGSNSCT